MNGIKRAVLGDLNAGTPLGLINFDASREGILQLIQMSDDQDLGEVVFDDVDGLDQALPAARILRAEASSITSVCRRAPLRWASTSDRASRMAKFTRKASPPEYIS